MSGSALSTVTWAREHGDEAFERHGRRSSIGWGAQPEPGDKRRVARMVRRAEERPVASRSVRRPARTEPVRSLLCGPKMGHVDQKWATWTVSGPGGQKLGHVDQEWAKWTVRGPLVEKHRAARCAQASAPAHPPARAPARPPAKSAAHQSVADSDLCRRGSRYLDLDQLL